jgi:hypothetical protein
MNDALDHGPEADDRPFGQGPQAPVPPEPGTGVAAYRPQPSRSGRAFRWWLGLSLLLAIAFGVCVAIGVNQFDFAPMHIVVDGDDIGNGITINGLGHGGRVLLAVCALLVALLLLLLVPLILLLVVGSVAIALVCALGVPLIAVALAVAAVTSPLWLVGLLIWLAVRRRPSPALARSATMTA